jgi:hypothetical protein
MEQSGAPAVFLHLIELARGAAARLRDGGAADRRNDHRQRLKGDPAVWINASTPWGARSRNEEFMRIDVQRDKLHGQWNYTIIPNGKRKLSKLVYLRRL